MPESLEDVLQSVLGLHPYSAFHAERIRAHALHGEGSAEEREWNDPIMLSILIEEVGEVARVFNERALGNMSDEEARDALRLKLVQCGGMVAAYVDNIDNFDQENMPEDAARKEVAADE